MKIKRPQVALFTLLIALGIGVGLYLGGRASHREGEVTILERMQVGEVHSATEADTAAWARLNPPEAIDHAPALLRVATLAYAEPPRGYHTLDHALSVLACVAGTHRDAPFDDYPAAFIAALFHDAIYVVGREDNEARSAELAELAVARHAPTATAAAEGAARLIRLTARHGRLTPADVSPEEARFLDCDMAILAADTPRYDAYEAGVKAEYAPLYPGPLYDLGRRSFLEGLLEKERIFLSDEAHERLDARARGNIRRRLGE